MVKRTYLGSDRFNKYYAEINKLNQLKILQHDLKQNMITEHIILENELHHNLKNWLNKLK